MKKIRVIDYKDSNSLISAVLFFMIGAFLFINPGGIVKFISYIFGLFLIICGTIQIISYKRTIKNLNTINNIMLNKGIILILLGLFAILFLPAIEIFIRLFIGGWILYSGIVRLSYALQNKSNFFNLVIASIIIICGLYVILKANLVFSVLGLFIMIYSCMEIAGYIANSK